MKLIGIARLGRDAETRHTTSGKIVANLSLAYNFGLKDSNGDRKTQWVEAALWGQQAERLQNFLLKGTLLNVTCRDVHIETFDARNGQGFKLVGTVMDVEFVPGQRAATAPAGPQTTQRHDAPAPASTGSGFEDMDDDIPF